MASLPETNERAPLLSARTASVVEESSIFPHTAGVDHARGGRFRIEIFSLLKYSVPGSSPYISWLQDGRWHSVGNFSPVILAYTLQNSVQTFSILIVGRLGPHELSVAAFALMLAFVTG